MHEPTPRPLNELDRERASWQLNVPDFGEREQERLRGARVLVTRGGGLGSPVAYALAAAGVGTIVLAHAGDLKPSDLNRQILMNAAALGTPRVTAAANRLRAFRDDVTVIERHENVSKDNAAEIVGMVDLVVDCAPLFAERLALNDECVAQSKPMVECAMYELQATITTFMPGHGPCLRCLVPNAPAPWQRRFPVFGAVSATVGALGAMEAIKVLSGLGEPLCGRLLSMNLRDMKFHETCIQRNPECPVC